MVPILLSDKYVTIKGMGGMSRRNLRIGDLKSVLPVHDPKNNTEQEIMCIFCNYGCHTSPEERMKISFIRPALQLEEKGIIIEDRLKSLRSSPNYGAHVSQLGPYTDSAHAARSRPLAKHWY